MTLDNAFLERAMYRQGFDGYRDVIRAAQKVPMFARKTLDAQIMWDLLDGQKLYAGDVRGDYRAEAIAISIALQVHVRDLFGYLPVQARPRVSTKATFKKVSLQSVTPLQAHKLLARVQEDSADIAELAQLRARLSHVLCKVLSPREERAVRMFWGLGTPAHNFQEIAQSYNVSIERGRQIYLRAMLKLRHSRMDLGAFLEERHVRNVNHHFALRKFENIVPKPKARTLIHDPILQEIERKGGAGEVARRLRDVANRARACTL